MRVGLAQDGHRLLHRSPGPGEATLVDAGGTELPVDERRLTRARRAVEKAVFILREPDDTDKGSG